MLSQESNQTLKLPFSRGHCLQISRTVLAPSLYVIVFLSLLPLRYPECSNEWQSGSVVLIYCMAAWMELGLNMSVRDEHLRCTKATNCSFRSGFQPDVVYMSSLWWQLSVVFSAAPVLPTALPSCPSRIICSYTLLQQTIMLSVGREVTAVLSFFPITRREQPLDFIPNSFVFC